MYIKLRGVLGFLVLQFWPIFVVSFWFLDLKTMIFRFCCPLWFVVFLLFSNWFSGFWQKIFWFFGFCSFILLYIFLTFGFRFLVYNTTHILLLLLLITIEIFQHTNSFSGNQQHAPTEAEVNQRLRSMLIQ